MSFWKILRVLVTDRCNLNCFFCHNEGQKKADLFSNNAFLDPRLFKDIVIALRNTGLVELRFSGGEPFLHPDILDLIRWANDQTDYELGCATNALLLSKDVVKVLATTRIKLTINLPSIHSVVYKDVTKKGELNHLFYSINLLKSAGVLYSFNHVLHPKTVHFFPELLDYCIREEVNLKLLPYHSSNIIHYSLCLDKTVIDSLDRMTNEKEVLRDRLLWHIKSPLGKSLKVKYLLTPCLNANFFNCRDYAEVRLLPDGSVMSCQNKESVPLDHTDTSAFFVKLWNDFTNC